MGLKAKNHGFLILALVLGAAGFSLPLLARTPEFSVAVYLLATTVFTFELLDIVAREVLSQLTPAGQAAEARLPSSLKEAPLAPYAIVMSVHNFQGEADKALRPLEPLKAHVWIVDDGSDDETALYLRSKGWRCLRCETNRKKPGAIKALIGRLPEVIRTIIVLDPDSAPVDSGQLDAAVLRFQHSGAAACCPRIKIREDGPLVSFQLLECELVFALGRKGMSPFCITSGVSLYERATFEAVLGGHSLSVYAEDLENSIILLECGLDIHFEDGLVVETEGKRDFAGWFSQRVGWSFGLLRVCAERWREISKIAKRSPWAFYNFAIYMECMTVLLFPIKAVGILILAVSFANSVDSLLATDLVPDNAFTDPGYFSVTYLTYTVLAACMVAYLRPRARATTLLLAVTFYLFYAAANAAAMAVGYLNWFSLRLIGRRVYRDHYTGAEGPAAGVRR